MGNETFETYGWFIPDVIARLSRSAAPVWFIWAILLVGRDSQPFEGGRARLCGAAVGVGI